MPIGCMSAAWPPVGLGRGKPQADRVVEHVRWRVDLDVQGPPQGGADGGAVGCCGCVAHFVRRLEAPLAAVGIAHRHLPCAPVGVLQTADDLDEGSSWNASASATVSTRCRRVGSVSGISAMNT